MGILLCMICPLEDSNRETLFTSPEQNAKEFKAYTILLYHKERNQLVISTMAQRGLSLKSVIKVS